MVCHSSTIRFSWSIVAEDEGFQFHHVSDAIASSVPSEGINLHTLGLG
jgi:hypothetical protein